MKSQKLVLSMLVVMTMTTGAAAQSGKVVRYAPELDAIVPAEATIEKLAGGFGFTEGPIWLRAGFLLFTDYPEGIKKWTPAGSVMRYPEPDGAWKKGNESVPITKTNGLTLDRQGRLIICEQGKRRVARLEADGTLTVLTEHYQGKLFNSPNDVVVKSDGSLYFTDPPYGLEKGDEDPSKEIPFNGVYRLAGGRVELIHRDLTRPNGLAFSPDEKYLYVANSDAKRSLWMRFPVKPDATLGPGVVFYDVTGNKDEGLPDGMKVDRKGNVYGTGPGGVWVFSLLGKVLGIIKPPEVPANCNWGDADGKTLYLTARTGLYRIRLRVAGVRP